jgi:caffeoyl-CoA O-methyltransferase
MSSFLEITPDLHAYLVSVSLREPASLRRLREETAVHPRARMQVAPEQGQLLQLLAKLVGARRTIEVGVFTGYSALAVALALPEDGRIVACDVSAEYTAVARRHWREAGVEHKIDLRLAPAAETLRALVEDGGAGTYDLAFVDADKSGYPGYVELCAQLLRPNGLLAIDNTLWSGRVARPAAPGDDEDTRVLRALNEALHRDERFDLSLLPVADGLTLCRKR